ncbi:hypothetical protein GQ600_17761 [Phytophthora cactorum]|nr:hypothetical protein GQ600_17761 [Phytophthora cactorum]
MRVSRISHDQVRKLFGCGVDHAETTYGWNSCREMTAAEDTTLQDANLPKLEYHVDVKDGIY